ncbi:MULTISPECIES: L,D-transpeptidase [Planktothricoides]|nr:MULTISPECIES: L,D-transpeptidase [Planktothricoides]
MAKNLPMMRQLKTKSQSLTKRLMLATSSILMFLLSVQQLSQASSPQPVNPIIPIKVSADNAVRLPPLGSLENYIPLHQVEPAPITQSKYLVISLSDRQVHLYENEELKISYPIAIGKEGWETPTGQFNVLQMLANPYWEHPWTGEIVPPGEDNPLGTRWIGFWTDGTNFIGFHGTPNEDLVGQAVSHGCIRMKNDDVVALFEQVEIGTTVIVKNEPIAEK